MYLNYKYYWLTPNGKLINVTIQGHTSKALNILYTKYGISLYDYESDQYDLIYQEMYDHNWIRVGVVEHMGESIIEINHGKYQR